LRFPHDDLVGGANKSSNKPTFSSIAAHNTGNDSSWFVKSKDVTRPELVVEDDRPVDFSRAGKTKGHVLPNTKKTSQPKTFHNKAVDRSVSDIIDSVIVATKPDGVFSKQVGSVNKSGIHIGKSFSERPVQSNFDWADWSGKGLADLISRPGSFGGVSNSDVADSMNRSSNRLRLTYRCVCHKMVYPICLTCPIVDTIKCLYQDVVDIEDYDLNGKGRKDKTEVEPVFDKQNENKFDVLVDELDSYRPEPNCESFDYGKGVIPVVVAKQVGSKRVANLATFMDGMVSRMQNNNKIVVRKPVLYKRWFKNPSRFDASDPNNHQLGALERNKDQSRMAHETIPDSWIIIPLFEHLSLKRMCVYPDREACLAHLSRLATKWAFESKFNTVANIEQTSRFWATVQKCVDSNNTSFLVKYVNPDHERNRLKVWFRRHFSRLNV